MIEDYRAAHHVACIRWFLFLPLRFLSAVGDVFFCDGGWENNNY